MSVVAPAFASVHRARAGAIALLLTGCSLHETPTTDPAAAAETPPASAAAGAPENVAPAAATATILVRHADGTPAKHAEVAIADVSDWTQLAPTRRRTDDAGRVVLPCERPLAVAAWSREPAAVFVEPRSSRRTYVVPGSTTELPLTTVRFVALDVEPAVPSYVELASAGAHELVSRLPGVPHGGIAAGRSAWRFVTATRERPSAATHAELTLSAEGHAPAAIRVPVGDGTPTVVEPAALPPRPWTAPRLEVLLPDGTPLGETATALVMHTLLLSDDAAPAGYFPAQVRHGMPGRVHVPASTYTARANVCGHWRVLWTGALDATTEVLRLPLGRDVRPVHVTLQGLLAVPAGIVVEVAGTAHHVGDVPSTVFGLDATTAGDPAADAETTRRVVLVPPGEHTIALREANAPHRPIGEPLPLRVDAAPDAAPARVLFVVRPR